MLARFDFEHSGVMLSSTVEALETCAMYNTAFDIGKGWILKSVNVQSLTLTWQV